MRRKVLVFIIHAVLFVLSITVAVFTEKGKEYFRYIYIIDDLFRNSRGLTTSIVAILCDITLIIIDISCFIMYIIKIISSFFDKHSFDSELNKLLYWGVMIFIAITTLIIYFKYYIVSL